MFTDHDISRDDVQLYGGQASQGYDWWWHSFRAYDKKTRQKRSFYVEYFLCNPASGQDEPVFGQLPENQKKKIKPSYLMVNAGTWGEDGVQLHRFFGWNQVQVDYGTPYRIEAGDCLATENRLTGSISVSRIDAQLHPEWFSDAGTMSWDLKVEKQIPFNVGYGASRPMRDAQLFEMFWHAEGMKTAYSGTVTFNGTVYEVDPETCNGYADENWGKDFTTPWLWLSSNDLYSALSGKKLKNSAFDIGGGRPKIGPVALKGQLLSAFFYEGEAFEFNFSKFWTLTRTRFHVHETDTEVIWHVEQENWRDAIVVDIHCAKKDMLLIRYEAPNGRMRHTRLWNGASGEGTIQLYRRKKLVDLIRVVDAGCEYGEYDAHTPYR